MTKVSVIVPCYNEQNTIQLLLDAINKQTFPIEDFEVIIADGNSQDLTVQRIHEYQKNHPDLTVKVVDNTRRNIPAALNCALRAARGKFIVRLDAHSMPAPDYIERCVADLEENRAENVGGIWQIKPGADHWVARSIAAAASNPVGVGDARYRYTDKAGYVETVPFGSYPRSLFENVGYFDETLLTNEDYEFNTRVRNAGGRIWLNPEIKSVYFARADFLSLARQYWRYGYWKFQMLRRYPGTIRWRQALPPLFVLSLIFLAIVSFLTPYASLAFFSLAILYGIILIASSIPAAIRNNAPHFMVGIPVAISVMHLSWGTAFLFSLIKSLVGKE